MWVIICFGLFYVVFFVFRRFCVCIFCFVVVWHSGNINGDMNKDTLSSPASTVIGTFCYVRNEQN